MLLFKMHYRQIVVYCASCLYNKNWGNFLIMLEVC